METLFKSVTRNDISRYKTICEGLITKTKVSDDYNHLRILFIDNSSLLEFFQREITQAIGVHFQGKLPRQAYAYSSKHGRGAIAINTEHLKDKTTDYCEFVILEKFCYLLDYAAADFTQSDQFLSFCNDYSKHVGSRFSSEVSEYLIKHYNQYYVNKLVLSFDVEKWIRFKSDYYGPRSRAQLSRLFAEIRATRPAKHCLAIITTEILRILCFARSVESFLAYSSASEIHKQRLIAIRNNAIETISFAEKYARTIDKSYPSVVDYFILRDFVSKDSFFIRVREFWNYIHLFEL